jgi:hydroxyethylthiazole kinase-like uncharacterized protein yjeF
MPVAPVCEVAAIRAIERAAGDLPLMERAGDAAAQQAGLLVPRTSDPIVVFAGPGNNGGDAFVVARRLREWGYRVALVFAGDAAKLPPDARGAFDRWTQAGGAAVTEPPALGDTALLVDGLFGIGLARPPEGVYAEWIAAINHAGPPVLALDVPSGLDADTGVAPGPVICATHTATFIALKPGLLTADGVDACGAVTVHDLGIGAEGRAGGGGHLTWAGLRSWVHPRRRNSHKGTYGTLAIVGGAAGMTGAALLAGRAALCAGAGKVLLGFLGDPGFAADLGQPELMLRNADELMRGDATAMVVGPGLSQSRHAADVLARALSRPLPLVLDADALNLLALEPALRSRVQRREQPTLVTPHPAEAARLLETSTSVVQRDRLRAAREIAGRLSACVALKGAGTVCASPDGEWSINGSGNAGLASGGTGDVLAGVAGALLAQGYPAFRALQLAVCVHGAAADALVDEGEGPIGLTASELPRAIRRLLNGAA